MILDGELMVIKVNTLKELEFAEKRTGAGMDVLHSKHTNGETLAVLLVNRDDREAYYYGPVVMRGGPRGAIEKIVAAMIEHSPEPDSLDHDLYIADIARRHAERTAEGKDYEGCPYPAIYETEIPPMILSPDWECHLTIHELQFVLSH